MVKKTEDKAMKPKPVKKAAKTHLSTFLITVNSQVDDKKYISRLKDSYDSFYQDVEDYIKVKSEPMRITSISSQSAIERGNRRHAYHIHALIKIEHTGKIHLNLDKMRTHFNTNVKGDGKCYLDCKFVSDPTFTIQRYFNKETEK
jgi:predicted N-formylglutamate amidohydrolase